MDMKRIGIVLVAVLLLGVTTVPVAVAQDNSTDTSNDSEEGIVDEREVGENETIETIGCISQRCTLKIIEYDIQDNGLATIKLYSTTEQPVTLTSMDFRDGHRQLNQKKNMQVSEGIVTLQIYVDNSKSKMGFTTSNPHGISQFKVDKGGFSFDGVYSGNQMMFFGSFMFIGGVIVVGVATYRKQLKLNGEIKQEL